MSEHPWWHSAVIYQIYPRSFQDSNGDGIGDLPGAIARLDHLVALGIDTVWLSPFYPSPMADYGYDVANYTDVDPMFGTLADFDRLVAAAHERGLRLLVDFVPNHTSSEHPWFRESRASRDNPKRDWYIWRDPAPDGGPPTNWLSISGGGAWTFDAATGQYYLHSFLAEQPDLNWRNLEVKVAMYDVLRFWLKRGVDGFRVDVIGALLKDPQFRDNPPNPDYQPSDPDFMRFEMIYSANLVETVDICVEMREVLEEFPGDRLLVGELYLQVERLAAYYGKALDAVHLPFNFNLIGVEWTPSAILKLIRTYEASLPSGAWPDWVTGNHDRPRVASRVGRDQARAAMVLLLTLRGTPTIYYGEELGLDDVPIPPERRRDPFEPSRDGIRTPMLWDGSEKAGFTTGEPWLPIGAAHRGLDVAAQAADPASMLALTRALLHLRRDEPALAVGDWSARAVEGDVLAYDRTHGATRFAILLNLSHEAKNVGLGSDVHGRIALSTLPARMGAAVGATLTLAPDEAVIVRLG